MVDWYLGKTRRQIFFSKEDRAMAFAKEQLDLLCTYNWIACRDDRLRRSRQSDVGAWLAHSRRQGVCSQVSEIAVY